MRVPAFAAGPWPSFAAPARIRPFPRARRALPADAVSTPPAGDRWWHEIKWDGYRLIAYVRDGGVCLRNRRRKRLDRPVPDDRGGVARAAGAVGHPGRRGRGAGRGRTCEFSALQVALGSWNGPGHRAAHEAVLYAFDLLYFDGRDLRREPLEARGAALASILSMSSPAGALRLSEHVEGQGEAMFRHACRMGLEGIVSNGGTGLCLRAEWRLAQDEVPAPRGVRDRRLHSVRRCARRAWGPGAGQGGGDNSSMPVGSGPGSRKRAPARS